MLTFSFTGVSGEMTVSEPLTSGMIGREVQIDLSEEWDGLTKTAVFAAGYVCRCAELTGATVVIPEEVLRHPYQKLRVGVRGDNADGTLVIPTIMAEGPFILRGADPAEDTGADETVLTGGTAEASDIAEGMTAYVRGQMITGTLAEADAITLSGASVGGYYVGSSGNGVTESGVQLKASVGDDTGRVIAAADTVLTLRTPYSNFGDAAQGDVLEGVSFTSAAGLRVSGTLAPEAELVLEDAVPGGYFSSINGSFEGYVDLKITLGEDAGNILLGPGSVITLRTNNDNFGTATAADVAAGKTFTSGTGFRVTGTREV